MPESASAARPGAEHPHASGPVRPLPSLDLTIGPADPNSADLQTAVPGELLDLAHAQPCCPCEQALPTAPCCPVQPVRPHARTPHDRQPWRRFPVVPRAQRRTATRSSTPRLPVDRAHSRPDDQVDSTNQRDQRTQHVSRLLRSYLFCQPDRPSCQPRRGAALRYFDGHRSRHEPAARPRQRHSARAYGALAYGTLAYETAPCPTTSVRRTPRPDLGHQRTDRQPHQQLRCDQKIPPVRSHPHVIAPASQNRNRCPHGTACPPNPSPSPDPRLASCASATPPPTWRGRRLRVCLVGSSSKSSGWSFVRCRSRSAVLLWGNAFL